MHKKSNVIFYINSEALALSEEYHAADRKANANLYNLSLVDRKYLKFGNYACLRVVHSPDPRAKAKAE